MLLLKFIIDFTLFSKLWEGKNRLYLIWGDISLYINDCRLLYYILHILVGDLECTDANLCGCKQNCDPCRIHFITC